ARRLRPLERLVRGLGPASKRVPMRLLALVELGLMRRLDPRDLGPPGPVQLLDLGPMRLGRAVERAPPPVVCPLARLGVLRADLLDLGAVRLLDDGEALRELPLRFLVRVIARLLGRAERRLHLAERLRARLLDLRERLGARPLGAALFLAVRLPERAQFLRVRLLDLPRSLPARLLARLDRLGLRRLGGPERDDLLLLALRLDLAQLLPALRLDLAQLLPVRLDDRGLLGPHAGDIPLPLLL